MSPGVARHFLHIQISFEEGCKHCSKPGLWFQGLGRSAARELIFRAALEGSGSWVRFGMVEEQPQ